MTPQAQNCLKLYYGGNVSTIVQLLNLQKKSVLNELMNHFGTTDIDQLANCLSLGKRL